MPMATGIPQKAMQLFEDYGCSSDLDFCNHNTLHAPFARAPLNFLYAESYARIGDKDKALHYLNLSRQANSFMDWPLKDEVLNDLKNKDEFLNRFAKDGLYKLATFDMTNMKNRACISCHGRS
ncbi:hypothetical protein JQC92_18855 [Shewanella sp. 202IG2-18]|uniref:hypothetical protein n=1 Tax=Parashewanella hymeniacidonis TaxID=2807618 RepID=UPI001960729B|nr:hypothetical protein [Parashewanella hymeniacidonis]MBM7074066.1 hypothetical protein [Parashewanella hymeniacidonis]